MRIDRLKFLSSFKNLQEGFEIDFDEKALVTVIVGQNGTGKSNILEALVLIFRDLDLGPKLDESKKPPFAYELEYEARGHKVKVKYDPSQATNAKRYDISVDSGKGTDSHKISINKFSTDPERTYLPRYVFGYYSGPSNRLEEYFEEHQERFYRALLSQKLEDEAPPARPLLYARLIHSRFALLAFFLEQDEDITAFLHDNLRVVGLDSVLFILKTPEWAFNDAEKRQHLYWTATGTVKFFMERLYAHALVPFRFPIPGSRRDNDDYFYLYIKDEQTLQNLAAEYISQEQSHGETGFQSFFKALESTYISDLIHDVRIKVKIKNVDGSLTYRELSEGEQQLLMVLGLLRFTKEDESLFLLDEPDTHLNPAWSIRYLEFIGDVVGQTQSSQLIMNTHNPLTLATLEREQVVILNRDEETGTVTSDIATQRPRGMGVGGILTSDIFKLRSVLDPITLHELDRQRELSVKAEETTLTHEEEAKLAELNDEVSDLDFRNVVRDPLYPPYVSEITKYNQEQELNKLVLSDEERKQQRSKVREIVRRLKRENGEG